MFWAVAFLALAVVLVLAQRFGRRRPVTRQQLERQRRQLGIHDGKGSILGDR